MITKDKQTILLGLTELVLDAEKRLEEGYSIDLSYSGSSQSVTVNVFKEKIGLFTLVSCKIVFLRASSDEDLQRLVNWVTAI